jgi:peptide-methionine (S)-S-oxide reductase
MAQTELATVAGGCFWGVEDLYQKTEGVIEAVSGFMGGHTNDSTYREVCSGLTGHAEVVNITFDPEVISYKEILHLFWEIHNPTTLNRQGPDIGTQYRSAIFTHSEEQTQTAIESKEWAQQFFDRPIVTEIHPASHFIKAEEYHQDYFEKNGGHGCHIRRPIGRS